MKNVLKYAGKLFASYICACLVFFLFYMMVAVIKWPWFQWLLYGGMFAIYAMLMFLNGRDRAVQDLLYTERRAKGDDVSTLAGGPFMRWKGFLSAAIAMIPVELAAILVLAGAFPSAWGVPVARALQWQFFLFFNYFPAELNWPLLLFPLSFVLMVGVGYLCGPKRRQKTLDAIKEHEKLRFAKVGGKKRRKKKRPPRI